MCGLYHVLHQRNCTCINQQHCGSLMSSRQRKVASAASPPVHRIPGDPGLQEEADDFIFAILRSPHERVDSLFILYARNLTYVMPL